MVNDVIGGHVTSKFLNILCKNFLLSSKNMRQHFFVKYVKTKLVLDRMGEKLIKFTTVDDRINKSPTPIPSAISSVSTPTTDQVNLPKLQLRKFDGSPLHWQSFWDQYAAVKHES